MTLESWAKRAAELLFDSGIIIDFYHTKLGNLGGHHELTQLYAAALKLGIIKEAK
jgi:hypothetical protein